MLIGAGLVSGVWLGPIAVPILLGIVLVAGLVRGRLHYLPCAVVIVAGSVGAVRGSGEDVVVLPGDLATSIGGAGTVASLPSPSRSGDRVLLRVDRVRYSGGESRESDSWRLCGCRMVSRSRPRTGWK